MEEAKKYLVLRGLEKELENLLNLESLGLEVKIEKGKLIIVKRDEDWERSLHVALWWNEEKLFLTVDLGFFADKSVIPEELRRRLERLKERLQKFYRDFCPSVVEEIREVGYYGIKVKEFNTHICEIIGHIVVVLCITLLNER